MDKLFQNKKIVLIIAVIILLMVGSFIVYTSIDNKENDNIGQIEKENENVDQNISDESVNNQEDETLNDIKIVDVNSDSRPIAVMVNNLAAARKYHSGLQDAYLVYEMIVEGGITRLMAVFKDKDTAKIGSVRSSRHYYLDYALENDAIYVHYGWSPQAQSDISSLGVKNINGLYDGAFWREKGLDIAYEHTAYTSIEKIKNVASNKNYSLKTNRDLLLNYTSRELDLSEKENSKVANSVDIKYSTSVTTNYIYNSEEKIYYRSVNDKAHKDYGTKKQYTAKNIIIAYVSNSYISNDSKGRQELNNIGTGNGYYITNGVAVPITWEKQSRSSQTVYKYKDGAEIVVSDGNTYIQIAPKDSATIK